MAWVMNPSVAVSKPWTDPLRKIRLNKNQASVAQFLVCVAGAFLLSGALMRVNVKSFLKKEKREWLSLARKNNVPPEIIRRVNSKKIRELKGV
jgi:hypothetical protein